MVMLHIEHAVPNYEGWKKAFDEDPVGRRKMGVRRYRILRPVDDPLYVMIDLEFDSRPEAEALLAALRDVWSRAEGRVMTDPKVRLLEVAESNSP